MTAGSQQFTFKLRPHIPHVCHDCGKQLKRDDVAEIREYPLAYYRCKLCAFPKAYAFINQRRTR